jgi:hypothetical protein
VSATEILTGVLVLVTAYYAWQNRRMVREMTATRKVAVLPKLALEWTMASPVLGFPTVKNVGPGPALDVDISVHFVPLPGKDDQAEVRRWTASVITSGEEKQFLPPGASNGGSMDTEALAKTYSRIILTGSYRDALEESYEALYELTDIAEWRRVTNEAVARWEEPDQTKRLAKELTERLGKKTLVPAMKAIGQRLDKS